MTNSDIYSENVSAMPTTPTTENSLFVTPSESGSELGFGVYCRALDGGLLTLSFSLTTFDAFYV